MTVSSVSPSYPVILQSRPDQASDIASGAAPAAGPLALPRLDDLPQPNVAGDGTDPIEAAKAVAKAVAGSNNLEVSSFHDEATGRLVVRVADRWSGRVLIQIPPEDLLRFFASAPEIRQPPTIIDT